MGLGIDPKVDYAFKRLFGSEENAPLLVSLLNAVVVPARPVSGVEIVLPHSDKSSPEDKLTIGDVKARAMFGGHGFYLDGVFFAITARERVFFKVDEQTRSRYEAAGMAAFRPFDDHSVLHSYYEVPPAVLADGEAMQQWATAAQAAARRVATAKPKPRRRRTRERP